MQGMALASERKGTCSRAIIMADLKLKLLDTLLNPDDVLLKGGLIILELGDLLLEAGALGLLVVVVALDLLLHAVQLVSQGLPRVLLLHRQHTLQGLLLTTQDLGLLLVSIELLLEGSDSVIQVVKLALEVSSVVRTARGHIGRRHHGLNVEATGCAGALLAVTLT
jgi:hypothetical protein